MREILFRGKRVSNGEWVYGNYAFTDTNDEQHFIFQNEAFANKVTPETVGQYTGLTDKKGKKIFEGDYWLDTDGDYIVYVVEFRDGQFCFVSYGQRGALMPYGFDEDAGCFGELDCEPMTDFIIENVETDGNVYDNPDVLKDEIPEELAEILWSE